MSYTTSAVMYILYPVTVRTYLPFLVGTELDIYTLKPVPHSANDRTQLNVTLKNVKSGRLFEQFISANCYIGE